MSKEHRAMAESQADTRGSQIQDLKVPQGEGCVRAVCMSPSPGVPPLNLSTSSYHALSLVSPLLSPILTAPLSGPGGVSPGVPRCGREARP